MSRLTIGTIGMVFSSPIFLSPRRAPASGRATGRRSVDGDDMATSRDAGVLGGVRVRELLERIRGGDRAALGIVYTALFEGLWKFALLHTRSSSAAMDVVQDVFLSVWMKRETLRPETDIGVYLAVAVRHNAVNRNKHHRVVDHMAAAVSAEYLGLPGQSQRVLAADARVEVDEFMSAYHRAVATLTERERMAAFLRWEEGWTFERIGEVLSVSNVGARKIILRAQTKVQALLAPFRE